jgi:hypothetical protein
MLNVFHKIGLCQILWRKGYRVWLAAAILILGAAAWSISFPFQKLSSNFQAIISFCVILGIAMLAIGFYVLRIGNRRHEAAENALRRANEILEKRVTELAEKEVALDETDWAADHSTPWFNQMTTNLQLCLDQANSRSESADFLFMRN